MDERDEKRTLSAGKLRGLMTLADGLGVFKMVAVDQRPPIFKALARHGNREPGEVAYHEVADVKRLLTKVLAPASTAILIDPIWTHPQAIECVPGQVGLISTLEDYAFTLQDGERLSTPIQGWSVEKIKLTGAQGVKVLVWDRPDTRPETREHQDAFVAEIGEACRRWDIPYILEILTYPKPGEVEDSAAFARVKPEHVLGSLEHFAAERFGIDLLKLQFPADLKYCDAFADGAFDGKVREAVYSLAEVEGFLRAMHERAHVPWVLLSAGVGPKEFEENLKLAFAAGASGFLAGRAIWLDALDRYPDLTAVEVRLVQRSLPYLQKISELAKGANAWRSHPRYGGKVALAGRSERWYEEYGR